MIIGYLGPEGTYSQQAVERFVKILNLSNFKKVAIKTVNDVLEYLNLDKIDAGVVPLKNNLAGYYKETVDGLKKYNFGIIAFTELQIRLTLGIHPKTEKTKIREIRSKDMALLECASYLKENYPNAKQVKVKSTARAIKEIIQKDQRDIAAIGSEIGMKLYGLQIVDDDIGDKKDNFTKFLYLKRKSD